jgi:hypothetical protein
MVLKVVRGKILKTLELWDDSLHSRHQARITAGGPEAVRMSVVKERILSWR